MSRVALIRGSVADAFSNPRLWLLHLFSNALLFALATTWLLIPVANTFHLIGNVVLVVVLLAAVLILHGGTLNYFSGRQSNSLLFPAFRRAALHLFAILACLIVFYLLWLVVDKCESYGGTLPAYLRSILPVSLRRHITLSALDYLFAAVIFSARWIVAPGLVLPGLLQASSEGFRAFRWANLSTWRRSLSGPTYWFLLAIASVVGVLVTEKIMALTPDFKTSTFHGEALSLAARLFCAYVLAVFSWFLACSVVARRADSVQSVAITRDPPA